MSCLLQLVDTVVEVLSAAYPELTRDSFFSFFASHNTLTPLPVSLLIFLQLVDTVVEVVSAGYPTD